MALDTDSRSGSLGNNNTATLTVNTQKADHVWVTIDDGTEGNNPSEYTITVSKQNIELSGNQFVLEETGRTDRSWRFEAVGKTMEIDIKNTSGSSDSFDVEAESVES